PARGESGTRSRRRQAVPRARMWSARPPGTRGDRRPGRELHAWRTPDCTRRRNWERASVRRGRVAGDAPGARCGRGKCAPARAGRCRRRRLDRPVPAALYSEQTRRRRERRGGPMNERILAQILVVASAGFAAFTGPADAVAQERAALTYPDGTPHPMTPWGDPDLQGMWPIMHLFATPLQRNPQYGNRRFLTDEEYEQAQAVLDRKDQRYYEEIQSGRLGMGHWAESTTRTPATRLTSLISYPPDGRLPELTPRGEELVPLFRSDDTRDVFDSPLDFDAWDRCITRGLPSSMLPYNYNNGVQIMQAPGYVIINLEMIHESR